MVFRNHLIPLLSVMLCLFSGCRTSPESGNLADADPIGAAGESQRVNAMQNLMKAYHRYHQFNGAVLVAEGGRVVYADSFGQADVGFGVPNTTETRFRIASITKVFTAVLLLQLVDGA